jgi:hypothetical protein
MYIWAETRLRAGLPSFLYIVQTGSGAYPAGTGGSFPVIKWTGSEADLLPLSNAEVKNVGSYTTVPHFSIRLHVVVLS